jgi:large subunit ribosomal protein L35
MPKMKTNSGAKKRLRITKKGKIMRASSGKRHILEKKSPQRKRRLRGLTLNSNAEKKRVRRMLPYS